MISIKVKNQGVAPGIKPKEMYGKEYGQVYEMTMKDTPSTYFMSCGAYEPVIMFWWCSDEDRYFISSQDLKSLEEYLDDVFVKQIEADIKVEITFK